MLEGEYGEATQLAMILLTRIGDLYEAENMVKITSSHVLGHYGSLHDAGIEVLEKFASLGGRYRVLTTVDPASMDLDQWRMFKVSEDYAKKQLRLCTAHKKMGVAPIWSCTPYLCGNLPKLGQHIAWAESSAICFANSVLGAKTNRLTVGLEVASSITGRTPRYGLHLSANRIGQVHVRVCKGKLRNLDYHTIGYILGRTVGNKIPVLTGLPKDSSVDQLKSLGAAAASSGPVALLHAVGLTPEARTREDAFGEEKPTETIDIGSDEIREAEENISTISENKAKIVAVGCPHYSVEEMTKLAKIIEGRRIREDVQFWVYTSKIVENIAREMGIANIIEDSGTKISTCTCAVISPLEAWGFETMMTNSAKFANVIPSEHGLDVYYAPLEECVQYAIKR
jgi:predicted aconitase